MQIYTASPNETDAPLMGLTLLDEIKKQAGERFSWTGSIDRLTGIKGFASLGKTPEQIIAEHAPKLKAWYEDAKAIMLYR